MRGELVAMRLFDLGAEVDLAAIGTLLGHAPRPAPLEPVSAAPPSTAFARPIEVEFSPASSEPAGVRLEVRVHSLGALTVRCRVPLDVAGFAALPGTADGVRVEGKPLDAYTTDLTRRLRVELGPALHDPYESIVAPERYDVYCIHLAPREVPGALQRDGDAIAQLISGSFGQELTPARRAAAAKHTLQYTPGDAVVIGWDHAVVLDEPGQYEDVLDVMELANAELLEFRTYDEALDRRLESSFAALDRLWRPGGLFRSARAALQDISRLRVEFARLTDNLHDTGKVFGDWYTAQLHRALRQRFHLESWEKAVATKMDTLEDMFHLAQEESNHRRSLVLEVAIVLLFVLDLILLVRVEA